MVQPKDLEVLEDGSIYASMVISHETPSDLIQSWTENKKWEATYAVTLSAGGLETALSVKNKGDRHAHNCRMDGIAILPDLKLSDMSE